jgi:glycosyltransferase involved in cell wall biosynthesis
MMKNIWIVNPYGTLPSEGWRDYRSFMLANALANRGHQVLWWISDFEHRSKKRRADTAFSDPLLPANVKVAPIQSRPYDRNISFGRIAYEKSFGEGFAALAPGQEAPDMVVLADPSLFYSRQVLKFVDRVGCKLVIDILDLWPELFKVALPSWIRSFDKFLFSPLYSRRRRLLERADGVVAVSKDFVTITSVAPEKTSCISYLGVDLRQFELPEASEESRVIKKFAQGRMVVIYAGTLGDAYDIGCALKTIELCEQSRLPVSFVFAGDGPKRGEVESFCCHHAEYLLFLGTVPASKLPSIYAQCDVGLCSYAPESTVSMPVKVYDYLAAGLYVYSSLETEIADHLRATRCGEMYRAGSAQSLFALIEKTLSDRGALADGKKRAAMLGREFDSVAQHDKMAEFLLDLCEE